MLQHLELYSGIGGMRLGIRAALPPNILHSVSAVDINRVANRVYEHNFGDVVRIRSIEHCRCGDLDIAPSLQQQAHSDQRRCLLWTLSPPCQPYTTTSNSKQQDINDDRASSLSHLLELLPQLQAPPTHLLLENVPAFNGSRSHEQWSSVLSKMGYEAFDVILCPSQLGLPHRRPRHYTLARLVQGHPDSRFSSAAVALLRQLSHPVSGNSDITQQIDGCYVQQLQPYLELDWSQHTQPLQQCTPDIQQQVTRYALSASRVARYHKVLDIVAPESTHTNCFTKGYQKNILGCGSYLLPLAAAQHFCERDSRGRWHLTKDPYMQQLQQQLQEPQDSRRSCNGSSSSSSQSHQCTSGPSSAAAATSNRQDASTSIEAGLPPSVRVRAFTPREVANLQGFPASFTFPAEATDRQCYALLGNSVSVDAVSFLAKVLLEDFIAAVQAHSVSGHQQQLR